MITLEDIAYVRSGAADLQNAVRFAVDIVGLELVAEENDTAYLRADHRHHCLALVEGDSGVLASGFLLADTAALDAAHDELELAGVKVACLMRIDPVHHKFAVFQGDRPGLCHMNFQVETLD